MWKQLSFLATLFFILALVNSQTCGPRVRRSWYSLTDQERTTFIQALNALKRSGEYDIFTAIHADQRNTAYAHGRSGFFVWHRKFLLEFENALRSLGPQFACITLPYWPFETEAGREAQSAIFNFFGGPREIDRFSRCVTSPNFRWNTINYPCLQRTFSQQFSFIGEARIIDLILNNRAYGDNVGFRSQIEGSPHAGVHNFIGGGGGHMGTMNSPSDPFFYVLHTNVDRLFTIWSDCYDYETFSPAPLTNMWPDNTLYTPMPFFFQNRPYRRFNNPTTPFDMYHVGTNAVPYTYDTNDRLVGLIQSTVRNQCNFNLFFPIWSKKRSVEETEETEQYEGAILPPSATQSVLFSDARVQSSFDNICTVEIPDAPRTYQIHATAIAECNICTGFGARSYATDEWIANQNMQDQKEVFEPICKPHNTQQPTYTQPQQPIYPQAGHQQPQHNPVYLPQQSPVYQPAIIQQTPIYNPHLSAQW